MSDSSPTKPSWRIRKFERRFGRPHLDLACHAAVAVALTPDLLYRLWAYFGAPLDVPWIAVADLLLSDLCEQVGYERDELFELREAERAELRARLEADPRFGRTRAAEVAAFLLDYVRALLDSPDPAVASVASAQRWTALAYTDPQQAARELAAEMGRRVAERDGAEIARTAALVEVSRAQLEQAFPELLAYARGAAAHAAGDTAAAAAQLDALGAGTHARVAGEQVPLPTAAQPPPATKGQPGAAETTPPELVTIDVRIAPSLDRYTVTVRVSTGAFTEQVVRPPYSNERVYQIVERLSAGELPVEEQTRVGETLFRTLFDGLTAPLYRLARIPGARLRLALTFATAADEDPVELLPWELLYDPAHAAFLALERVAIVRVIPRDVQYAAVARRGPLRILWTVALLGGTPPIDVERTSPFLRELAARGDVEYRIVEHVTPEGLLEQLAEHQPHVWHHTGYVVVSEEGGARLTLEDDAGGVDDLLVMHLVGPAGALGGSGAPTLVVLEPAETARDASAPGAVVRQMVEGGVSAGLGMRGVLPQASRERLFGDLYRALAAGAPVDVALAEALAAVRQQGTAAGPEWPSPMLYAGSLDALAPLIAPTRPEQPTVDRAGLARALLDLTYTLRASGYDAGSPLHRAALRLGLGTPLGPAQTVELVPDGQLPLVGGNQAAPRPVAVELQPFGGDTLYRTLPDGPVLRLSELAADAPEESVLRDAAFRAAGAGESIEPSFATDAPEPQATFLPLAQRAQLGAALQPPARLTVEGADYVLQVFARDTLVSRLGGVTSVQRLSDLARSSDAAERRLADALLAEVAHRFGARHRPSWAAHRIALDEQLGPPLANVRQFEVGGVQHTAQVFAGDTLFVARPSFRDAPAAEVGRLSRLVAEGLLDDELAEPPSVADSPLRRGFIVLGLGATLADALSRLPHDRAERAATYVLQYLGEGSYLAARWDEVERAVLERGATEVA